MKLYLYQAGDEKSHKLLGDQLRQLKEGEWIISVKRNRAIRSLSANRYLHFAIQIVAIHTGHTHEEIYEITKLKFNSKLLNMPKSGQTLIGQSTKGMDTAEFSALTNRFCKWALDEFGIVIPQPGDLDLIKQMEIENQYEKMTSGF
jgi:hypothetical protein